ncbi:hypothetical protein WN867_03575 [Tetragenococcus halophilus]|uniref:hypothetical protein n=1 Tax=Tetragenococcus halophilus TaxID=51669 RepID=UPI0030C9C4D2
MSFEIDIEKQLNKKLGKVKADKLFTKQFMKRNTDFNSLDDFVSNYDDSITSRNFHRALGRKFDKYVSSNSKFSNWNEMLTKAVENYL